MDYLPVVLEAFLKMLYGLEIFFFTSISELPAVLNSLLGWDGPFFEFLEKLSLFVSRFNFFANITPFDFLLGGGLIAVLLYKLILFIVPVAD